MQKGMLKALVLSVTFVLSVLVFGFRTNQENEDLTIEMQEATLPMISMLTDNIEVNNLYGYTKEMDAAYMRDTITPIASNRILPIKITTNEKRIDGISYEIRSLDATRLIANAKVEEITEQIGFVRAELTIQNLLEKGQEYLLKIILNSGDEEIFYYTRIVEPQDCYVTESIAFVKEFHSATFDKESVSNITTYLEPGKSDNTNLHYTSLHSSLKQVTWADFQGKKIKEAVPSIKEITPTYNVITLKYVMTSVGDGGIIEYYNVEENYRVRYTKQRMYLLNFERSVNEIFRGENANIQSNMLNLGIRAEEVEYKTTDTGNMAAFVQEGELWSYDNVSNHLTKVFSFRGYEGIDELENLDAHDIKIINIDEAGSITYIVYGYMNRGNHEGEVGIVIYHYDGLANTNEEVLFIPTNQTYEVMKSDLGQLMYVNDGGMFYIMMGDKVYGINLATYEVKEVVTGLRADTYAVSKSNRFFAWIEPVDEWGSNTIKIMDFMTEKQMTIQGENWEYLKPLGFLEEDFIYGLCDKGDVQIEISGIARFPMKKVMIAQVLSQEMELLKTYEKDGYYISDIEIEDYTIYLNRMQKVEGSYVEASRDMIMNREADLNEQITIEKQTNSIKQAELCLRFKKSGTNGSTKLLTPKEMVLEEAREVTLAPEEPIQKYYVYANGKVLLSTGSISEAVLVANENMGVVVDQNQNYMWKRSRKTAQSAFRGLLVGEEDKNADSIARCMNAMLEREGINISVTALLQQGETPKEILTNALKEATILDLSGCGLDEILYYISNGTPVFAMEEMDEAVLIVGYDANYISIYDPMKNSTYRISKTEAEENFLSAGSIFLTYLK